MGAMMRAVDWSATPLGPVAGWPQGLRTALSMMLESRFAMVVAWGPEFRLFYNDRYTPVLGSKHPRSLGTPAAEIFPEIWHIVGPKFEAVRRGEPFAIDDWLLPLERSGYRENCWFTVSYSPIRDESGGIGGLLAVVAETTGRVEGERRMATLRELAADAARARTPEEACASAARVLERNPIDVPFALLYALDDGGRVARRLAHPGLPADHAAAPERIELAAPAAHGWPLARVGRTGEVLADLPRRFGALPGGPDAEPAHGAILLPLARPGHASPYGVLIAGISPRRALDDRYRGFFELAADHIATAIANARALEEEHRRAEALAELDRAKTAFFSNVSHEFRTPLTLMLGPLEDLLAGRHGPVPPDLQVQHELVHRNARRLLKLVGAMLDFSRIEAGRMHATYEPTDLAAYTAELAGMFRAAIERAGLVLVVDCPPLPEPVFVDRELWEKIVLNLLSNAFKFTFEGRIEVRLRRAGDRVELAVRDTGCGIPREDLGRVFERFHRVARARARTHEGTGIGLSLALELARLHGGTIDVASELGAGAEFTVRIPAGRAHLPGDHVVAAARPAPSAEAYVEEAMRWLPDEVPRADAAPGARRDRVLIADDNAEMRNYLRRVLAPHWHVIVTCDGAEALAEIRRAPPDLVVTDVMMPGLDGFALLAALRADERTRELPVIMLSARAGDEARIEGLVAGAGDYLVKPFSARELVARVSLQLSAVAARRAAEQQRQTLERARHRAEAAAAELQEAVSLLDATLATVPIGLAFFDRELRFVRVNDTLARWNGWDPQQLPGRALADVAPPASYAWLAPRIREAFAAGQASEPAERSGPRLADPGEPRHWLITFYPVRGALVGLVAVDVTDEVRAREELARTVQYNEKFTAILGHDLRNPLNAIMMTAQLLERRAPGEEIARPAARIVASGDRMRRMIDQLLDLARVRVTGLRLSPRPVDLGELCRSVLDELRAGHPESRLELVTAGSLVGRWDGDRLAQVLSNLAANAIEHGAPSAPVRVRLDGRDPDRVGICVENQGAIPAPLLPVLFDPFRSAEHRSAKTRGLGLGLYISHEIIAAHRGRLTVRSDPAGGTCFEVELSKREALRR
jgi:PAS domain S-box-containing protein